jgi:hypothetical protein
MTAEAEIEADTGAEPQVVAGRRSNGDVVRFDPRNGALGVFRGDVIVAYFRPDEGYEYFLREIAK